MKMISNKYLSPRLKFVNRPIRKRFIIKAHQNDYENYQIFQHKDTTYNNNVNINDVDDHLEAVSKLKKEDKDDYFMAHGLDYDRCYEYINIIKYLNRCWKLRYNGSLQKNDNKESKNKPIFAPLYTIIGIIAFVYYYYLSIVDYGKDNL